MVTVDGDDGDGDGDGCWMMDGGGWWRVMVMDGG